MLNYQIRLFAAFLILAAALAFAVVMMTFTATAAFAFTVVMMTFTTAAAFAFTVVMVALAATAAFTLIVVMMSATATPAFTFIVMMVTATSATTFTFIVMMVTATSATAFTFVMMMVMAAAAAATAATAVVRTRQRNGSERFLSSRHCQTHAFEHGLVLFNAGNCKAVFGLCNTHTASRQGIDGFLHQVKVARDLEDRFRRSFDLVEATVFVNENVTNLQRTNFA